MDLLRDWQARMSSLLMCRREGLGRSGKMGQREKANMGKEDRGDVLDLGAAQQLGAREGGAVVACVGKVD
jgi:hypothetical protein